MLLCYQSTISYSLKCAVPAELKLRGYELFPCREGAAGAMSFFQSLGICFSSFRFSSTSDAKTNGRAPTEKKQI